MTDRGLYGVDMPFKDGLFVLRAENSMGKSTCLKAILVALGMEAVLTASRDDLPLPPVLKDEVLTGDGRATVIESDIFLEIENRSGDRIVTHRTVKGPRNTGLIEVIRGPALSKPGHYHSEPYYVGRQGDTTRDLGFLRFLINFLGWNIPVVRTYQGDDRPLYLQCIVPYFFIEQSRGWSTLEPPVPTRFGIKEVHKRTVEYLLDLDATKIAARRLEIEEAEKAVQQRWSSIVLGIKAMARNVGGVVQRLPANPVATWPPPIPPALMLPKEDGWITLEQRRSELRGRLDEVLVQEIPRVAEVAQAAELELGNAQEQLNERQAVTARLLEVYDMEIAEVSATRERLLRIDEDLQRNRDTRTLLNLGGSSVKNVIAQQCPTCHQHIVDSLVPLAEGQSVMSVEENIKFLEEQRRTFKSVLANQEKVVEARACQVMALREEVSTLRGKIRSLKETVVSEGRTPSVAAVYERVQLDDTLERLRHAGDEFATDLERFSELAAEWHRLQIEKSQLPPDDTSQNDRAKIARWGEIFREQLRQYDFKSLQVADVKISEETYRPLHEGFDLPTNISASDFIRVIWSYLNGLRELSAEFSTNHPGLLVFDEPRQQSAKDLSFQQLLQRVAKAAAAGHQVIFATSEKEDVLCTMLAGVSHTYQAFRGHIIKRIEES